MIRFEFAQLGKLSFANISFSLGPIQFVVVPVRVGYGCARNAFHSVRSHFFVLGSEILSRFVVVSQGKSLVINAK